MSYERVLEGGLRILSTQPDHAAALETLQRIVFPSLDDSERFKAQHYLKHLELFPEGQFVAVDTNLIVAATSSIRMNFDFSRPQHRFADVTRGGWLTAHQPDGEWLYGADIGVHPNYRRRGVARALYRARQETVERLGLKGQLTVGMLRGYGPLKRDTTAESYYESVLRGEEFDPTVSVQMRLGFEPRGLIPNYIGDPICDGYGVLLVLNRHQSIR